MTEKIFDILTKFYGYTDFRPGQKEIIENIVSGKNVLAILPTGGGKSLCYQIPAMLGERYSLVISPLIALMKDQVDALNKIEPIAAFTNSAQSFGENEQVMNSLGAGKLKILYVSPERLENNSFLTKVKNYPPEYLFVDEAHCISQWGHSFRPSYKKIKEFSEYIGIGNISAFTATATPVVQKDIVESLNLSDPVLFVKGFFRDNLAISVIKTRFKKEKTFDILSEGSQPAIVYCATRKNVEELTDYLQLRKLKVLKYHGGMTPELRRLIQEEFLGDRIRIIVATNAFGMGIDKADIRTVIHYNMPGTVEHYYQEIGRGGRDGEMAKTFLLYAESDIAVHNYFIANAFPSKNDVLNIYDLICDIHRIAIGQVNSAPMIIDKAFLEMIRKAAISGSVLDASIKILENNGYLKKIEKQQQKYYFRFLLEDDSLKHFVKDIASDSIKEMIIVLLREFGRKIMVSKVEVNIDRIGRKYGLEPEYITARLAQLGTIGIGNFERPSGSTRLQLTKPRIKKTELEINFDGIESQIRFERERLDKMIGLVNTDECRMNYILNYFGEMPEDSKCMICDNCTGNNPDTGISEYLQEIILETIKKSGGGIETEEIINILHGKSISAGSRSFSTFGSCLHFGKDEILDSIRKLESIKLISLTGKIADLIEFDADGSEGMNAVTEDLELKLKLTEGLKEIRKRAARRYLQDPELICPEYIIREIADKKPVNSKDLLSMEGFTIKMYHKIGEEFLEEVKLITEKYDDRKELNKIDPTGGLERVLAMLRERYALSDISKTLSISEKLVSVQVETLLKHYPELDVDYLFEPAELKEIKRLIKAGYKTSGRIKEQTEFHVDHNLLRIALGKYSR